MFFLKIGALCFKFHFKNSQQENKLQYRKQVSSKYLQTNHQGETFTLIINTANMLLELFEYYTIIATGIPVCIHVAIGIIIYHMSVYTY